MGVCAVTVAALAGLWLDRWLVAGGRSGAGIGHLAALGIVVASSVASLRRGWFDGSELGLGPGRHGAAFARGLVEGIALLCLLLLGAHLFAALTGRGGIGGIVRMHEDVYGFRRILLEQPVSAWPWAYVLTIPIEEILFRGLWFGWFAACTRSTLAPVLGQSVAFAVWHSAHMGVLQPHYVVFGVIYGELRRVHATIAAPLGFHFGWNAALVAVVVLWPA